MIPIGLFNRPGLRFLKTPARFILEHINNYSLELRTALVRVNPRPIFILGNQKSGTTVIAALLSEYAGQSLTSDLVKEMKQPLLDRVHQGDLSFHQFIQVNKLDFSRSIIKEPSLTLFYDELAEVFSGAKFVFVVRDPRENIRSLLQRLKLPGNLADLSDRELAGISPAWRLIINGEWFDIKGQNYIEMLAGRWLAMTSVMLDHMDRIVTVRFEEFLQDKQAAIASLAERLDLKKVRDISSRLDVQYQPAGDRTVNWQEFFGSDNLERIDRICRPSLKALGYPPNGSNLT